MKKRPLPALRLLATSALAGAAAFGFKPAMANPTGGQVVGGSASISSAGNTLTIQQTTSRAIINWQSFDIGSGETTQFQQPSSSSIALNRVTGSESPSQILGNLSANGQVWIINPNGVMFGGNAQVNVAGLVATSANIKDSDFMSGNYVFSQPGNPNATISNAGQITTQDAGLVAFVAPNVSNAGLIQAKLGKVQLASGDSFTLDLYGDGLINLQASAAVTQQIVANSGTISANGGQVMLTAAAAENTVNSLINMSGVVEAQSIGKQNGEIVLYGEGSNAVANNDATQKGIKTGTSEVDVSGTLDASGYGAGETGGSVTVTADHVALMSGSRIDASGDAGGGYVKVGGDFHGGGTTPTASATVVQDGATIKADASTSGDGGKVAVWSDGSTAFAGNISARGGSVSGNGGNVETSGHNLIATGLVNAGAPNGKGGTWLLDPNNIDIEQSSCTGTSCATADAIGAALSGGSDVTVTTTDGSITLGGTGNATITDSGSTNQTLTFSAGTDIVTGSGTTSGAITASGTGKLSVVFDSDTALGGGAIVMNSGSGITSNGGNITLGGGTDPTTMAAIGDASYNIGVNLNGATVNAGGGNIIINGVGDGTLNSSHGIQLNGSGVFTSGSGTITLYGDASSGSGYNNIGVNLSSSTISAASGSLSITGLTGGYSIYYNEGGIATNNSSISTTSGNINLVTQQLAVTVSGNDGIGGASENGKITIDADSIVGNRYNGYKLAHTSGNVTFKPYTASTAIDVAGSGGTLNITTGVLGDTNAGSITIGASGDTGLMTLETYAGWNVPVSFITGNSGSITVNGNQTGSGSGSFTFTGPATLSANLTTAGGGVTFNSPVTLGAASLLTSAGGNVDFGSTVDGAYDLTVNAGNGGSATFTGAVGSGTALGQFSVTAGGGVALNAVNAYGVSVNTSGGTGDIVSNGSGTLQSHGAGVYLTSGHDINISNALNMSGSGNAGIGLTANNDIVLSGGGTLNSAGITMTLDADHDGNGAGAISISNGTTLQSGGADMILGGGNGAITAGSLNADGTLKTAASGFATGDSSHIDGISISNATLNAGGGTIIMNGAGYTGSGISDGHDGVSLSAATIASSGAGTISITGIGGKDTSNTYRRMYGVDIDSPSSVTTANGTLTVIGTGGNNTNGYNQGIELDGTISSSGSGNILINGTGGGITNGSIYDNGNNDGIWIYGGKITASGSGNIAIVGTGDPYSSSSYSGSNYGINGDYGYSITASGGTIAFTGTAGLSGYGISNEFGGGKIQNSGGGSITITAAGAGGDADFYADSHADSIGGSSYSGNVIINADTLSWGGSTVQSTGNVTFEPRTASTPIDVAGSGTTLNLPAGVLGSVTAGGITIGSSSDTGPMTLETYTSWNTPVNFITGNSGSIAVNGAQTTSSGGFTFTGPTTLSANLTTAGSGITFNSAVTLGADSMLTSAGGNVDFVGTVDGAHSLAVNAGGGDVSSGVIGAGTPVSGLSMSSGGGTWTLGGAVTDSGNLTITAGTLDVTTNNYAINVGGNWANTGTFVPHAGTVTINGTNPTISGTDNFYDLVVQSAGSLTLPAITANSIFAQASGATSDITVNGALSASGSGDAITLVAGRNFINNAGSGALSASSGRWLVYSTNPADNTTGGLSASFDRYSCTYGGSCPSFPSTGNGLMYSYTPLLTVTPNSVGVTYGTAPSFTYSLSGYNAGDSGNDTISGAAGSYSTNATQSGSGNYSAGTWNITVGAGTLASALGYGFTGAANTGGLVISPMNITAALSGTVSKNFDGNTSATLGSHYSLAGEVSGDRVSLGASSGNYDSPSIGSDKTVTFSGLSLQGADAGDYHLSTLSMSAPVGEIDAGGLVDTVAGTANGAMQTTSGSGAIGARSLPSSGNSGGLIDVDSELLTPPEWNLKRNDPRRWWGRITVRWGESADDGGSAANTGTAIDGRLPNGGNSFHNASGGLTGAFSRTGCLYGGLCPGFPAAGKRLLFTYGLSGTSASQMKLLNRLQVAVDGGSKGEASLSYILFPLANPGTAADLPNLVAANIRLGSAGEFALRIGGSKPDVSGSVFSSTAVR